MPGARGEVYLKVGEREYPVLFNNRALAEGERLLGKTILQFAKEAQAGSLGVSDTAHLLLVGLEAGRREAKTTAKPFTMQSVFPLMDRVGFPAAMKLVVEGIAEVLGSEGDEVGADEDPPAE